MNWEFNQTMTTQDVTLKLPFYDEKLKQSVGFALIKWSLVDLVVPYNEVDYDVRPLEKGKLHENISCVHIRQRGQILVAMSQAEIYDLVPDGYDEDDDEGEPEGK